MNSSPEEADSAPQALSSEPVPAIVNRAMVPPRVVSERTSPYSKQGARPSALPKMLQSAPASVTKQKSTRSKRVLRVGLLCFIILIAGSAVAVAAKLNQASREIIVENKDGSAPALSYDPTTKQTPDVTLFQRPGDGRVNVLVAGIGGDGHPGGTLTDSLQIFSIDRVNNKVTLTSVPRDLYVKGSGGYSKINAVSEYGEQLQKGSGTSALKKAVGDVLGVTISNVAVIDFSGAIQIIDAMGGIDITVPEALYDPYFPDDATKGYAPLNIKAGAQKMDGKTALRYARSRETTSDFARSGRQQQVIQAVKKKAIGAGMSPVKINAIITAVSKNVRTDLQQGEILSLLNTYKSADNAGSFVLDTSDTLGLLTSTSSAETGYIAVPILGTGKYSAINRWFQKNSPDPMIARDAATIVVSGTATATKKQLDEVVATLKDYGFKATLSTKLTTTLSKTTLVSKVKDKEITKNYLGSLYPAAGSTTSQLPEIADFELIYGPSTK